MDKRISAAEVVAELRDGMTLGIGGWGSRRKPMALVREILRTPVKDLTVVSYGGPDVGLLCAAGKVRKLVYGFVSLDSIPLDAIPLDSSHGSLSATPGSYERRSDGISGSPASSKSP